MTRSAKAGFVLSFVVATLLSPSAFSQTLKEFFNSSETKALYLGLDFTQAKLIDEVTANEMDVRDKHFASINQLVVTEVKKFDLNAAFSKTNIDHDLGFVGKRNIQVDAAKIKSTNTSDFHRLKETDIATLVKGFDFGDKSGLGILFVVEAMSKSAKSAAIWVTFVDMKGKKVLLTERIDAEVKGGFGFRNYWASTVKDLLDTIEDKKYKEWKNKNS